MNVEAERAAALAPILRDLVDQVQEWAGEALWIAGASAVWPQCPGHPNAHPLKVTVICRTATDRNGDAPVAVWQCPKPDRTGA